MKNIEYLTMDTRLIRDTAQLYINHIYAIHVYINFILHSDFRNTQEYILFQQKTLLTHSALYSVYFVYYD